MALEITIKLRIDYDTANKKIKEPVMLKKMQQLAKEAITIAELTADSRRPSIYFQHGDTLCSEEEIKLVEDDY